MIPDVITWLNDPLNWEGTPLTPGIFTRLWEHVWYSGLAVLIALVIAIPLGLYIGHSGRMRWLVSTLNAIRALPTVGLLILFVVMISGHFHGATNLGFLIPTEIVLVLLAVPPVLAGTYSGVENVAPAVRDAARGMGMTGPQVLLRVELPNALPLIFSGIRSAALQVIATATIASYVTLGGLGRFIYDGLAQQDYPQMISGGVLVALLALLTDLVLATIQRFTVSRGVSGRFHTKTRDSTRKPPSDGLEATVHEAEATAR